MDKARIDSELKKYRNLRYIGFAILGVGIVIFVSMLGSMRLFDLVMLKSYQIRMIVCIVLMLVGTLIERRAYLHIKNNIAKEVAEGIIAQYIDDLVYDSKAPLIKPTLKNLYLALPQYDIIHASDHIKGTYKGRPIEIADFELLQEHVNDKDTTIVTVFLGPLLKINASKKISNPLTVSTNRAFVKDNIKTESVDFNKQFDIYCKDEHDAFYILTPQMMERMSNFEKGKKGNVYFCFTKDGNLYCAIDERRDRFELKMKLKTVDAISESFDSDIRYILGLIDELFNMDEPGSAAA